MTLVIPMVSKFTGLISNFSKAFLISCSIIALSCDIGAADSKKAAESPAIEFWNRYDARVAPLNSEVVKEWQDDLGTYQLVRFDLGKLEGSNRSASPKIAAYFGYPKTASAAAKVPGILQIHGGGQRANKARVTDWVKLGFACISINWGGKVLEQGDTPNTDWDGLAAGFVRLGAEEKHLTHHNPVAPGSNTLYKEEHLLNSSWNLIAMSGRRALTFLEQQPQVDADKLGVEGHSMGGRSTVLVSIDPRVRASSPSVGGTGYLYRDLWGLSGSARRMSKEEGLDLYTQVVSCQSYWPHITAPVMFLQGSNDFNAPNDLVFEAMELLPASGSVERIAAVAPHLNHRFTTETAAARFGFMESKLKGTFSFPRRSKSDLVLDTDDRVPVFRVEVDESSGLPIDNVEVFYGFTRDPRVRFWRSAVPVKEAGKQIYAARCPLFDASEPVFAFANITYQMPMTLPGRAGTRPTDKLTVTSEYQAVYPDALEKAGVTATPCRLRLIDDFAHGWRDWYRLSADNPHHWFYSTRKLIDPTWMGPQEARLSVEVVTSEADNQIAVGLETNTWQGYTGRQKDTFLAVVNLPAAGKNAVVLSPSDFKNAKGQAINNWDEITELFFTPVNKAKPDIKNQWIGNPPTLANLRWEGGEIDKRRPYPHESMKGAARTVAAFNDEFQKAIDDSVKLEEMDENSAGGKVYLTRAMASEVESFIRVNDNRGWAGKPISIAGKTYERGLGVHADSRLVFRLDGKFRIFSVVVGPDDAHGGTIEMKILVDNKLVHTTGKTNSRAKATPEAVEISVEGATTLTLVVESADGKTGGDHASWGDAFLVR